MLIVGGAIVAVCFGPKILKSWGKGAAESIREFRIIKRELNEPIRVPKAKRTGGN